MLARIDHWIGKTLFMPLIVKLCHLTRQTQYAVARLFWFAAMLSGLYRSEHVFDYIVFGLGSFFMMLTASLRADRPARSHLWFRLLALVLLVVRIGDIALGGPALGIEFWVFVLIAEYAATIRTLPPRKNSKPAARSAEAGA